MNEMELRVAKAICERLFGPFDQSELVSQASTSWQALLAARAAIAAMREPTDAMKNCNEEVHWGYSCQQCGGLTEGWYAMHDAALGKP